MPAMASGKVEPRGTSDIHVTLQFTFYTSKRSSTVQPLPPPPCLNRIFCLSEVQPIDRGPLSGNNSAGRGGGAKGGRQVEEKGKLKAFQAIAETIQLQCYQTLLHSLWLLIA